MQPVVLPLAPRLVLLALLWWFASKPRPRLAVSGMFLVGYGLSRFWVEFYRLPDAHIGYMAGDWLTRGQLLTAPMIVWGVCLLWLAQSRQPAQPAAQHNQ